MAATKTTTPLPAAARTNATAVTVEEREALARFIVDKILNADLEDVDLGEVKADARDALRRAGYSLFEGVSRD